MTNYTAGQKVIQLNIANLEKEIKAINTEPTFKEKIFSSIRNKINTKIASLQEQITDLKSSKPFYFTRTFQSYSEALSNLQNKQFAQGTSLQPTFTKKDGSKILRPLSFEESVDAMVNAYETGLVADRSIKPSNNHFGRNRITWDQSPQRALLYSFNDTSTGIAYKKGSTKFKIIPICEELITLNADFNQPDIQTNYNSIEGIELDRNDAKYDVLLTKKEILEHPAWRETITDKVLLNEFMNIVFKEGEIFTGDYIFDAMSFTTAQNIPHDSILPAVICNIEYGSSVKANNAMDDLARFISVYKHDKKLERFIMY